MPKILICTLIKIMWRQAMHSLESCNTLFSISFIYQSYEYFVDDHKYQTCTMNYISSQSILWRITTFLFRYQTIINKTIRVIKVSYYMLLFFNNFNIFYILDHLGIGIFICSVVSPYMGLQSTNSKVHYAKNLQQPLLY